VSVYVGVPMWPFGRMVMCHMVADTEAELDEMAAKLGLRRGWKQGNRDRKPGTVGALVHYDIAKSKRAQAIRLGAIPLDTLTAEAEVLKRLAEAQR
jgi:hypothetical protein